MSTTFLTLLFGSLATLALFPYLFALLGRTIGHNIRSRTQQRRELLFRRAETEEAELRDNQVESKKPPSSTSLDDEWEKVNASDKAPSAHNGDVEDPQQSGPEGGAPFTGVIAFFHPFCNAGGGGERVLFAALLATQNRHPHALCVVYTGDHDASKQQILSNALQRFNIALSPSHIAFLYLSTRDHVLANRYPRFTLLGQSLGSLLVAWDAFNLLAPDVYVDSMGYAFTLALSKWLFPAVPTAAYVHYPTISTDMLRSLNSIPPPTNATTDNNKTSTATQGLNAGQGAGIRGMVKQAYWHMFAWLYGWVGGSVDVVMTNSSWTQGHISVLWAAARRRSGKKNDILVVYPPCAVKELEEAIPLTEEEEEVNMAGGGEGGRQEARTTDLLYIAQFRPEKMHHIIIDAFHAFLHEYKYLWEDEERAGVNAIEAAAPSTSTSTAQPTTSTIPSNNTRQPSDSRKQRHKEPKPHLHLVGSVRDAADEKLVYKLRLHAQSTHSPADKTAIQFLINAPWPRVLQLLKSCSVGVNAMWNEHFGIGVVEYQAAGLISVVNDSGGPRGDIVVEVDGGATGFHATSTADYTAAFARAFSLSDDEASAMRIRARKNAWRFSEEVFERAWSAQMDVLVGMVPPISKK